MIKSENWIDLKERKPEPMQEVVTYHPVNHNPPNSTIEWVSLNWISKAGDWYVKGPTHWQPFERPL